MPSPVGQMANGTDKPDRHQPSTGIHPDSRGGAKRASFFGTVAKGDRCSREPISMLPRTVYIATCVFCAHCLFADDALRDVVIDAQTPVEAGRAYRRLFTSFDAGTLVNDQNTGIALQAYWRINNMQRLLLSGEPDRNPRSMSGSSSVHLSRHHVHRFLGFFEGRTKLVVPLFWEDDFFTRAADGGAWGLRPEAGVKDLRYRYAIDVDIESADVVLKLDWLRETVRLPLSTFATPADADPRPDAFDMDVSGALAMIVLYNSDFSDSYFVRAVDTKSGALIWEIRGWGAGYEGGSGVASNYLQVRIQESTVVVFGASVSGRYAEAFDARSGNPVFRFSTNYWNAWDPSPFR